MSNRRTLFASIGVGVGAAVVLLVVFFIGLHLGRDGRARFFPFWERPGEMREEFGHRRPGGHGIVGTIDSINDKTVVVKDRTGATKTIETDDRTIVRRDRSVIAFSDLQTGNAVIVVGEPGGTDGTIVARVIHVMTRGISDASGRRGWRTRGFFSIN